MKRTVFNLVAILLVAVSSPIIGQLYFACWTAMEAPYTVNRLTPALGMAASGAIALSLIAWAIYCALNIAFTVIDITAGRAPASAERSTADRIRANATRPLS